MNALIGPLALVLRLVIYNIAGWFVYLGWVHLDQAAGTVTINVDSLVNWLVAIILNLATFAWSRVAKSKKGTT